MSGDTPVELGIVTRTIEPKFDKMFSVTFSVWVRILPVASVSALIFAGPYLLLNEASDYALARFKAGGGFAEYLITQSCNIAVSTLIGQLLVGGIAFAGIQRLRGQSCSVRKAFGTAVRRIGPLLWTAFLMMICMFGATLLLIIPGLIVSAMLAVAVPVTILEGKSGPSALSRSAELTKGHRKSIFATTLVIGLIIGVVGAILGVVLGLNVDDLTESSWTNRVIQVVSIFLMTVQSTFAAVAYVALRAKKDGFDADAAASVFA